MLEKNGSINTNKVVASVSPLKTGTARDSDCFKRGNL